jgi:hypothetical protein
VEQIKKFYPEEYFKRSGYKYEPYQQQKENIEK